jgi:hypothetical protein
MQELFGDFTPNLVRGNHLTENRLQSPDLTIEECIYYDPLAPQRFATGGHAA